ncbi:GNAT family N-acetyltransferase [Isobaculum melis]|uniref:Putative acetyltransferase n=1 Tax=Isobaculum melis TaxID=142588 RepID=A0A1H9SV64_9LACT|nr:GNAT family N-acetyltransferase [Isobaculum melis]SER88259.1 putative acetyltransferase [Isobaculum melis]
MEIRDKIREDYPTLIQLWEGSVRKTHHFLSEADIMEIKAVLPSYFDAIHVVVAIVNNQIIGFAGEQQKKLEMLFIADNAIGKGYGGQLFAKMVQQYHICLIDVNEDNQQAKEFYLYKGFEVVSRSETDDAGRPFPILHLEKSVD